MNLQKNSNSLPTRRIGLVYSTGCYLIFLVTFLYLIGFVGGVLVPKDINAGQLVDWPQAALINGLLVILFGVQHSVMARKSFKRGLAIFIPAAPERSTYVLLSSLVKSLVDGAVLAGLGHRIAGDVVDQPLRTFRAQTGHRPLARHGTTRAGIQNAAALQDRSSPALPGVLDCLLGNTGHDGRSSVVCGGADDLSLSGDPL